MPNLRRSYGEVTLRAKPLRDPFRSRTIAIWYARQIHINEAAIQSVLAEKEHADEPVGFWFVRLLRLSDWERQNEYIASLRPAPTLQLVSDDKPTHGPTWSRVTNIQPAGAWGYAVTFHPGSELDLLEAGDHVSVADRMCRVTQAAGHITGKRYRTEVTVMPLDGQPLVMAPPGQDTIIMRAV